MACAVTGLGQPTPRFVDDDAPRGGDGLTWASAYWRLQNALDDAANGPVSGIYVAGGRYTPDRGRAVQRFDRDAAFVLPDATEVLGGFAGWDAPDPNQRDIERYETILSGDLRGDDPKGLLDDNSDNVVRTPGVSAATVLDGFTVTAATSVGVNFRDGSPTLRNCTFRGNGTYGVDGSNGTPTIAGCVFIANAFRHGGGGGAFVSDCDVFGRGFTRLWGADLSFVRCRFIDCERGGLSMRSGNLTVSDCLFEGTKENVPRALETGADNTVVTNCVFRDNRSGAILHRGGSGRMTVLGCVFEDNVAQRSDRDLSGGAIRTHRGLTVIESTFVNNRTAPGGFGGAIYVSGDALTVINCSFINNRAVDTPYRTYGGAIYIDADITIQGCDFVGNEADWGGAVGSNGFLRVNATDCSFVGNVAERAGAVMLRSGTFRNCDFIGNRATGTPDIVGCCGAIWAPFVNGSPIELTNCRFIENSAPLAGAVFLGNADVEASNCEFIRNKATAGSAGALSIYGRNGSWRNCSFIENTAVEFAGALRIRLSPEFVDCTFDRNSAPLGGAVYAESSPSFLNCDFTQNNADEGGALYFLQSQKVVERCRFVGNRAETRGGAIFLDQTSAAIGNSLFAGNSAGLAGGGLWVSDGTTLLVHASTFADNWTVGSGGGILLAEGSATQIGNSILWGNLDLGGGGEAAQITLQGGAQLSINYSTVQGWTHNLGGIGNTGDDPIFVDPQAGDYHLAASSPAIDRGDPDYRAAEGELDIDGDPRIWNARIDMGADEFRPLGDLNCDGAIDALDIEPFLLALFDPDAYESRYPDCEITLADLNRDHAVDAFDIEPFLAALFP